VTIELADVVAAYGRIRDAVNETPLLTSRTLDLLTGARRVQLKAECFQRGGSFKARGALNKLSMLDPTARALGVVAYSSGNHAQGTAIAAARFGAPAVVVMPTDAAATKVAAVLGYGAEIVRYDRFTEDRATVAADIAVARGMTLVPPYDDPDVIAGQGTATIEIFRRTGVIPDVLIVPVGGGGLISGNAIAAKGIRPSMSIIGVEAEGADDTALSLAAGRRIEIPPPTTIADGMRGTSPGELTFPIVSRLVDQIAVVTDDEIRRAVLFLLLRMNVLVEPTGAVGVAALLAGRVDVAHKDVTVILSGGNADPSTISDILDWGAASGELSART
jgi:threo-3-hydroxy-L-aspartate ammonia-lyase